MNGSDMKLILLILIPLFQTTEKLVKVEIGDKITVKIPEDFVPMSERDIQQRFHSYRKPIAAYTDPSGNIDFIVNFSYSLWNSYDLDLLKSFYKASLVETYSEINFITEDIVEIDNRQFVVFEFESLSQEEASVNLRPIRKYTRLLFALDHGQTILFNFTCPVGMGNDWQQSSQEIMETIKVK